LLAAIMLAMLWGIGIHGQNLPDSFLIDDENGISVPGTGEYFLYSHNLLPGDVITRTLTLRNFEQDVPYRLHLLADAPNSAGAVDWLDNLHLQITLDGRELYAGRLRGDGRNTRRMQGNGVDLVGQGLDLGLYERGDYGVLKFVVTADAGHMSTDDLREQSSARINWVFHAIKDVPPDAPQTGDTARWTMYILLAAAGILSAVFYGRYKKMVKRSEMR